MINLLLTTLRNKKTDIAQYRETAEKLALYLAGQTAKLLEKKEIKIETPIENTIGFTLKNDIVLVPILRSALALLPSFMKYYPYAKVGFVGLKRDEKTAIANLYYKNIPEIKKTDDIIILDPMIATGGSACDTIKIIKNMGIKEDKIIFVAVIGATDGINRVKKTFPKIKIICAQVDKKLNKNKYIIPGLGDFGDRYFGTL